MKVIPYTTSTGVKMGYRYNESPKPMPIDDPDMLFIQSLFIYSGEWHRQRALDKLLTSVFAGVVLVVVVLYMMVQQ